MGIFEAVINVLGVLLLIAAAAFIVVFLTDLVISFVEGKKGIFFSRAQKNKIKEEELVREEETKALTFADENKAQEVDFERAEFEKQLMDERDLLLEERKKAIAESSYAENENIEAEKEDKEDLDKLYAQLIDEINTKSENEEQKEEIISNIEESQEDDEDIDFEDLMKIIESNNESVKEEDIVEEPTVEQDSVNIEIVKDDLEEDKKIDENEEKLKDLQNQLKDLQNQLQQERESAELELAKAKQEKQNLEKMLEEKQNVVVDGESLESLLARKENLEERLKIAEKELKANKKEFLPLSKIKKSLESNESKLRRKEAIVAKKKIMLFGVNNYVVDEEKEQQLNDDLDALEALRLSVQHCEDVIKENADRYPILENTNKILTKTVDDLKLDLETVNNKIQAVQDSGNNSNE